MVPYQIGERVQRPWGYYEVTGVGDGYVTKALVVDPGECLSDQFHRERREAWIVEEGEGCVDLELHSVSLTPPSRIYLAPGVAVFIEAFTWHRLHNTGSTPLRVKEAQFGRCWEGDIVRRTDKYGRVNT